MTNPSFSSDHNDSDRPGGPLHHSENIAKCTDYASLGHQMHWIRARRSMESNDWEPAQIITSIGHQIIFVTGSGVHLMWNHDPIFLSSRANLAAQAEDAEVMWSAHFSMLKISVGDRGSWYCVGLQDGPITPCTF